jgi:hypothetical protein
VEFIGVTCSVQCHPKVAVRRPPPLRPVFSKQWPHDGRGGDQLAIATLNPGAAAGGVARRRGDSPLVPLEHDPEKWVPVFRKDHALAPFTGARRPSHCRV